MYHGKNIIYCKSHSTRLILQLTLILSESAWEGEEIES